MSDQRRGSGSRSSSSRSSSSGSSSSRSSTRPSSSGSCCFGTPTPAPCLSAARDPSPDEASDQAMRLLKRMKPSQLREISKAAMALERTKLENSKKVNDFIAKNENFVDLVGECYICLEPLLTNIGTTKFGVVSWKCRCKVPQKAHAACLFSKISRAPHGRATCDMCSSPIKFERTLKGNNEATIRFQIDGDKEEHIVGTGESSSDESSSEEEESSSEEEED